MNSIAEARSSTFAPGSRLDRYELISRLAVGGMAEIYLARATGIEGFEKLVVLKRILPQFAQSPGFVSMFLDEARLSATLQHPNIAQVYDIGHCDDSYFFTMEYVRGEDVRSILKTAVERKRRIALSHIITIITGVAAGLHAAHEKRDLEGNPLNVVHRDVSPSNVLVGYDGSVKLVDFGVAKAAQRRNQTQTGTLKGKVAYMSPEQCMGKSLDRRSDIFALGILLYELTCRRRLFSGSSEFAIMTKIVKEDVTPPSQLCKNYPAELERILLRALQRDPARRYPTAQAMQLDLEEFARTNRLPVSTVKLGEFMREVFVDRMREQDAAIARRPTTSEVEADSDDEPDVDIEVDEAEIAITPAAAMPNPVNTSMFASPLAATTPSRADSNLSQRRSGSHDALGTLGEGIAGEPVALPPPAAAPRRGRWPLVAVATICLGAALVVGEHRTDSTSSRPAHSLPTQLSKATPTSTGNPTTTATATTEPVATAEPTPRPVVESSPIEVASATGEPTATSADPTPASAESPPAPHTAQPPESVPRPATRSTAHTRRARHRSDPDRQPSRSRPAAPPKPAPAPAAPSSPAEWQLDSPLPPPRSGK